MWNKTRDEGPAPKTQTYADPPVPAAAAAAPPQPPPPVPPQPAKQKAIIGASMHIKGEIRSDEEVVVDGEVEGSVQSASLVTIGRSGRVQANIRAREVVIFGSVKGNIDAIEKLAIRDQGSLIGDIKTAGISIDDGAYFKGSIDISRPEPKVAAKKA